MNKLSVSHRSTTPQHDRVTTTIALPSNKFSPVRGVLLSHSIQHTECADTIYRTGQTSHIKREIAEL